MNGFVNKTTTDLDRNGFVVSLINLWDIDNLSLLERVFIPIPYLPRAKSVAV